MKEEYLYVIAVISKQKKPNFGHDSHVASAVYSPLTDPFAEADEDIGETKASQNYIHIRIQREFIKLRYSKAI